MDHKLLALFGLRYNPFSPDVPHRGAAHHASHR